MHSFRMLLRYSFFFLPEKKVKQYLSNKGKVSLESFLNFKYNSIMLHIVIHKLAKCKSRATTSYVTLMFLYLISFRILQVYYTEAKDNLSFFFYSLWKIQFDMSYNINHS